MYSVNLGKEKSISVCVIGKKPCWDWLLYESFHLYGAFDFMLINIPYILNITPLLFMRHQGKVTSPIFSLGNLKFK